jgi:hypothetical protein
LRPSTLSLAALLTLLALAAPRPLAAQSPDTAARLEGFLAPDHWLRLALRRAAADGLAPVAWIGTPRSLRPSDVRRTLDVARDSAAHGSGSHTWIRDISARLESDFGMPRRRGFHFGVRAAAGASSSNGGRIAGLAFPSADGYDYGPPPAVPDSARAFARVTGFAGIGPLVAGFDLEVGPERLVNRQLVLSTRVGPLDLRAGRQPLAFGPGTDDGVTLGPRTSFDGVSLATAEPFRLPSFLRKLGGVRASLLVARMDASGYVAHPWFAASRVSFEPSTSWALGLNRAVILGGEGNTPVTARRLLLVLFGETDNESKDSDFENQVASVDLTVRIGGRLALLGYVEYGFDDAGPSFIRVPGFLAGLEANRIPGLERVALGAELAAFGGSCCGHPAWYRHGRLAAGWSDGGRRLAHSLGGHGGEAALTWRVDPGRSGFLGSGRLFLRHRGAENVYSPSWQGRSAGARLAVSWPLSRVLRLEGAGEFEAANGWQRRRADLALAGWFHRSAASPTLRAP